MKIPYPGDLNSIETAVWSAEFVRERFRLTPTHTKDHAADQAVEAANAAVADLRRAHERHSK